MKRLALLLTLVLAPLLRADDFERVLFPVWTPDSWRGINAAQWTAIPSIHNLSSTAVRIYPALGTYGPFTYELGPHTSMWLTFLPSVFVDSPTGIAGRMAYVERSGADLLSYSDTLYEPVTQARSELPVARERDLRSDAIRLPAIPLEVGSRAMLRVYDPFQTGGGEVLVRVWSAWTVPGVATVFPPPNASPAKVLAEFRLPLRVESDSGAFNVIPGYAELALNGELQQVVDVEVIPQTPSMRIWAFVSVTDNATQHVFTIAPH